ncbi:pyruvate decarboxylase [Cladophialophora psammophila CBS 110553]|uniref:Pyruvate decarboxylase n=1 Tax=Cladophialophora psammophila CBS 110553 TaxID=1182543 RepID=W9WSH2_9EURO|nr:pyruvate decarboxylase [Cladophialophora psammophila CBS 110553]EXJ67950.1 pyruvate decarboxylase [Cladophialophora psammophila CBS 110553]
MSTTIKLAEYLFTRLHQLGVRSIHGVPGDYNLTLLDHIEPSGLHWVGNCNELDAGYAADGYARINGVGALITTFGVGELSAINAVAGAYCERAAVVHVVGTPETATQDSRLKVHHTFADGNYQRFAQMHAHITVAQESLRDPRSAPEQIDAILKKCLFHSRPVYIQVPVDLVGAPVEAGRLWSESLSSEITSIETMVSPAHDLTLSIILEKIRAAKQPMILVDGESRALRITEDVQSIVQITKWPTWVTVFAKGLVDETASNVHGVYRGSYDPKAKAFVDSSDLVLCFGPHFSSTNTFDSTSIPPKAVTISFTDNEIRIGEQTFRDIRAKLGVSRLRQELSAMHLKPSGIPANLPSEDREICFSSLPSKQCITQDKLWRLLANFIRPGDIVLGETGTAGYGVQEMVLPRNTRVFAPVTWLSIGYMLPATQGAALAQRELIASSAYHGISHARTVLFIGDGSFQMTVQELSTIIREKLDVIIFLLNNDGYTIERCIHGLKKRYNDIARWRYLQAPRFLGADDGVFTATVSTWGDLERVLSAREIAGGSGLRMVEIMLDREDVPEGPLLDLLREEKKAVSGES